jgi:hypothetical protein
LEHDRRGAERYRRLEPAARSRGIYGDDGTTEDFLAAQGAQVYIRTNRRYASLLGTFQQRISELNDFDIVEPREFWRVAVREALAEANFDFNPIIEALFDPDSLGCRAPSDSDFIEQHMKLIEQIIRRESDPALLATAAIMVAVCLGYSPNEVMLG